MGKTIVFYGRDGTAAKNRAREISASGEDTGQAIQADAWRGEALGADNFVFMDDVEEALRVSIRRSWKETMKALENNMSPNARAALYDTGATEPRASNLAPPAEGPLAGDDDNGRDENDAGGNPLNRDKLDQKPDFHGMTNASLRQYAEEKNIDLGGARTKDELIAAIEGGRKVGDPMTAEQLEGMTVEELKEHADDENIDLDGAHLKADIVDAILAGKKKE